MKHVSEISHRQTPVLLPRHRYDFLRGRRKITSLLFLLLLMIVLSCLPLYGQSKKPNDRIQVITDHKDQKRIEKAQFYMEQGHSTQARNKFLSVVRDRPGAIVRKKNGGYITAYTLLRREISSQSEHELKPWREQFRGKATSLYQKALENNNLRLLQQTAICYFFTDPGRKAMRKLAKRAYRNGSFSAARYWWKELIRFSPPEENILKYLFPLYYVNRRAGNEFRASNNRGRIRTIIARQTSGSRKKHLLDRLNQLDRKLAKYSRKNSKRIRSKEKKGQKDEPVFQLTICRTKEGKTVILPSNTASGFMPESLSSERVVLMDGALVRADSQGNILWIHRPPSLSKVGSSNSSKTDVRRIGSVIAHGQNLYVSLVVKSQKSNRLILLHLDKEKGNVIHRYKLVSQPNQETGRDRSPDLQVLMLPLENHIYISLNNGFVFTVLANTGVITRVRNMAIGSNFILPENRKEFRHKYMNQVSFSLECNWWPTPSIKSLVSTLNDEKPAIQQPRHMWMFLTLLEQHKQITSAGKDKTYSLNDLVNIALERRNFTYETLNLLSTMLLIGKYSLASKLIKLGLSKSTIGIEPSYKKELRRIYLLFQMK